MPTQPQPGDQHTYPRRLPVGAEVCLPGGVHFRVWAPRCKHVEVVLEGGPGHQAAGPPVGMVLSPEADGYFEGFLGIAGPGTLYRYRLDGAETLYPDPASRFQPDGPHGPSQVIAPETFPWTDSDWQGISLAGQVIYEMHIGTFTHEGTWEAASHELQELQSIGITVLEVMPVADFVGTFGWGYDSVDLFAPTRLYGTPDDFRRFIDQAHATGLGVILDVVYNHLGPEGNYLKQFADEYFTERYKTDWGEAINFDGAQSAAVREFFIANAGYWIAEFHLDGLRLDATQDVYDVSPAHILAAISHHARQAASGRSIIIIAENEPQHVRLVYPPEQGGYGIDALWNDDFHHSAMVALSGHHEAYYTDYRGTPQEFISACKWGYLYQGQRYTWQKQRRGTPTLRLPPATFVTFLQNHDQIANSGQGLRCHFLTSPGRYRALTALMLLGPGTPMLFQGQEFAASSPFLYFADYQGEIAQLVKAGRGQFLAQFRSLALPHIQAALPDPADPDTFWRSKLDLTERHSHVQTYALHRDLIRLRRDTTVFGLQRYGSVDGAVLSREAFVLRFFADDGNDLLLLVNLGMDLHFTPAPEPLLAPPQDRRWDILWSSEEPQYGGIGTAPLDTADNWRIPGHAAVVLYPHAQKEVHHG